jgi:cardiolipin synthase
MYGASREINIENAYFVALPAVTRGLLDALQRGVEVNILTNSPDTLNEQCKSMGVPLLKSLAVLKASGAGVYLKRGDTLHSKFMTVDGVFANIGSYNLHPRGERYDTELNLNILGRESVAELNAAFGADLAAAKKVDTVEDMTITETWLSKFIEDYFMAQLSPKK